MNRDDEGPAAGWSSSSSSGAGDQGSGAEKEDPESKNRWFRQHPHHRPVRRTKDEDGAGRIEPEASHRASRGERPTLPIGPADVLCGRGKASFNHAGNRRFRDSISAWLPRYRDAVHLFDKALIVDSVVDEIRQSGGRFLRYDHFASRAVNELSDHQVKEKVGRALRDAVASLDAKDRSGRRTHYASVAATGHGGGGGVAYRGNRRVSLPSHRTAAASPGSGPPPRRRDVREEEPHSIAAAAASAAWVSASTAAVAPAGDDAHEQSLAVINFALGPPRPEEGEL